jgi:hypothetical protein
MLTFFIEARMRLRPAARSFTPKHVNQIPFRQSGHTLLGSLGLVEILLVSAKELLDELVLAHAEDGHDIGSKRVAVLLKEAKALVLDNTGVVLDGEAAVVT